MNNKYYKALLLLFVFLFPKSQVLAQKKILQSKLIQSLISTEKDSTRTAGFIALPVIAYAPETGLEYGLVGNYVFLSDKSDSLTRSSELGLITTLTTNKQSNIKLSLNYWSPQNKYHYIALANYKNFPFHFYGIGDQTRAEDESLVDQKLIKLNLEVEKLLAKNYYAGLNAKFESYRYENKNNDGLLLKDYYSGQGGQFLAFGLSQLYDSRNSNTYTTKGLYGRLKYSYAPKLWEGEHFKGSLLHVDLRSFFPLSSKFTLGLNSIFESAFSKEVPFYVMPQLGNDEMMRGYYQGRFRDKNLMTLQSELRYRIHPRIGLAVFAATGTVFRSNLNLNKLKFSAGSGIHYFFNIEHDSSIRLDYAIGGKLPGEKRQSGFYISLGQAF